MQISVHYINNLLKKTKVYLLRRHHPSDSFCTFLWLVSSFVVSFCAKTMGRIHLQSFTTVALDNYTVCQPMVWLEHQQKYVLVALHFFSLYLILTGFGTSTVLCLVEELFSPVSPVFLATLGLDVPFLVDCGLVPFFCSWGLDEPVTPLRASRGLLEVLILGCWRESIGFKGLRPSSPQ